MIPLLTMHTSSKREAALTLRLAGKSYNEINKELGVAKSTLHSWLSDLQLSDKALQRIKQRMQEGSLKGLLKHNKMQSHLAHQRAIKERGRGRQQIEDLSHQNLIILGAALYWGEGYKKEKYRNGRKLTHHPVSLSNSDPDIIRAFLLFLRQCCQVKDSEIKVGVRIYEHMNEDELIAFWQKVTELPPTNFEKVYYGVSIASMRKRGYNRLPYGTVQVRVNSTALYHQIMGMIESLSRHVS